MDDDKPSRLELHRRLLREMTVWTISVTADVSTNHAERLANGAADWPKGREPMRGSMLDRAIKMLREG